MDEQPRTSWRSGVLASLALLGTLILVGTLPADEVWTERKVETAQTVEPEARRLGVITGTGHALRVLRFDVSADCRIEVSGRPSRLVDLERGQLVVIRHRGEEPYEAVTIQARPR